MDNVKLRILQGLIIITLILGSGVAIDFQFEKKDTKLYRDGNLIAVSDFIVNAQRTYFNLNSYYNDKVKCPKVEAMGGYRTPTRCYYPPYYYERIKRNLIGTEISADEFADLYKATKSTPYFAYGTRGNKAGVLFEEMIFDKDTQKEDDFPTSYNVKWTPQDTRNYQITWRLKKLDTSDYPDGTYYSCSYTFGNAKIDLLDNCNNLDKVEIKDGTALVYFLNGRGVQDYDLVFVDPEIKEERNPFFPLVEGWDLDVNSSYISDKLNYSVDVIKRDVFGKPIEIKVDWNWKPGEKDTLLPATDKLPESAFKEKIKEKDVEYTATYCSGDLAEGCILTPSMKHYLGKRVETEDYDNVISMKQKGLPTNRDIFLDIEQDSGSFTTTISEDNPLKIGFHTTAIALLYRNNDSYHPDNYVALKLNLTDIHLSTLKLNWNGTNETFLNTSSNLTDCGGDNWDFFVNKTDLTEGTYDFYIWVNDTAGVETVSTTYSYTYDAGVPLIDFVPPTPANNSATSNNYVYVNVTTSDGHPGTTFFDWNNSLIGWWTLNEKSGTNAADSSGNGNDGTISGMAGGLDNGLSGWTSEGQLGNGLRYKSGSDILRVNIWQDQLYYEEITISFWMYFNDYSHGSVALVDNLWGYDQHGIQIYISNINKLYFITRSDTAEVETVISSSFLTLDTWNHLTFVKKHNGDFSIYINGNMDRNQTALYRMGNTTFETGIGNNRYGSDSIHGIMDDIRLYNRQLSQEEINATFDAGSYRLYANFSNLSEGDYTYKAYSQDLAGNINDTGLMKYTFQTDVTIPYVEIFSPENRTYDTVTIDLNYTSSDDNLDKTWYNYNGVNTTLTDNTTLTALNNQQSILTLYANDSSGNMNSTAVTFTVDTICPQVEILSPIDVLYDTKYIDLNWSSSEVLSNATYSLNDGKNVSLNKVTIIDKVCESGGLGLSIWEDGTYIYLANSGYGLKAYTFNGTDFNNTGYIDNGGRARDVWGDGTYIYLANENDGIRAYTFDGSAFTNVGHIDDGGEGLGVWGDGTYVYIANAMDGLRAYTFDGSTFVNVGHIDDGGLGFRIWGDGTYIYLANHDDGIRAYTFDGSTFVNVGHIDDGGKGLGICGDGTYIYLANDEDGLRGYTFDGSTFVNVGHIDNEGEAYGVYVEDGYIYLANMQGGTRVYEFDGTTFLNVGYANENGFSRQVTGDGDYLYVADETYGLIAYTFDNTSFGNNTIIAVEGENNLTVYATDSAGHKNSTSVTFDVDTILPTIEFIPPTHPDGELISPNYTYINVSTADANAGTSFIDWDNSLEGWWTFNNDTDFIDHSNNSNDGVNYGTEYSLLGKFGGAREFYPTDYIDIPIDSSLNLTETFTVEAWVYPKKVGSNMRILWVGDIYTVWIRNDNKFRFADTIGNNVITTMTATKDTWYHVVGVYTGRVGDVLTSSNIFLYINGEQKGTTYEGLWSPTTITSFSIGKKNTQDYFNGTIDEIKIHSRVLSPEEVNASYNAGLYRLGNNFTNLSGGDHTYTAYSQDLAGNINMTETRTVTINVTTDCGCPGVDTDWTPDLSLCCNMTEPCNLGTGHLNLSLNAGTGYYFRINSTFNCTNMTMGVDSILYIGKDGILEVSC